MRIHVVVSCMIQGWYWQSEAKPPKPRKISKDKIFLRVLPAFNVRSAAGTLPLIPDCPYIGEGARIAK